MRKFKVGDKVLCIDWTNPVWLQRNKLYEVSAIIEDNNICLCGFGASVWHESRFELVEEPAPKPDLDKALIEFAKEVKQ